MSNAIGAVTVKGARGVDPGRMAARTASRMMDELDTNKDGKVDKREFVSAMTAKGMTEEDAIKQFDAIDTQKTGSINKADITSAIRSGALKPPPGGRPPAGARPAGGPPPAGGNASQSFAPADTNKDGTVDAQEAFVYSLMHEVKPNVETTDTSKLGSNVDETV
jgi:EF hand